MKLGLNLSFAVKRWLGGRQMAAVVRELGFNKIQFTWDLIDPWWPEEPRDKIAHEYARAFEDAGITVDSAFGGVASYSYNHFLAPTPELRDLGKQHLMRAVDLTAAMGVRAAGMPFGSYSAEDAVDATRREEIYKQALEAMVAVSRHAKRAGLSNILIEPVPLKTEFPSSAEDALRLMTDLDGQTDVPVRLLVDWGHAIFTPLFGKDANIDHWMDLVGPFIDSFHIQQTDGLYDRHWNFTREGVIDRTLLEDFWQRRGLTTQTYFLEIIYPFEERDEVVLADMKAGIALLRDQAAG
ncbi:TIM barrel protein [Mesorhizobium sp. DCY119]|uniref:TIM barrel protein n=1 Tax=Mesorhizobium sp. DCY119 TaxID=2108445 RepID=UPI000E761B35|nr:TIM barrel protein [Mesorhizobium sp. DCY119]RJG41578.1 sugar phosphate isomerase/epimerase [Mesorhizobium sp. DCY119]